MLLIFTLYFFLLGIIIGSFLNVVILRHNTGKTTKGRSSCMSCKTQLTWKELIPVLSFLFQKGKCKSCGTRLSWQYPLVELATGILFAVNFYFLFQQSISFPQLIISVGLSSVVWALMVVIFVYDLRHKIIPDIFSWSVWGVSIVYILSSRLLDLSPRIYSGISPLLGEIPGQAQDDSFSLLSNSFFAQDDILFVLSHISAGLFFYFIIWTIWKLSKGRLIGLGDAKLLLTIGTILGLVYGLSSIFIAVWIGTFYAVFLMIKQRLNNKGKHITMKTEIPFGPFLIIGFLIVYFFHIDVTNLGFILENFS